MNILTINKYFNKITNATPYNNDFDTQAEHLDRIDTYEPIDMLTYDTLQLTFKYI